jgi:hypothetical protein
MKAGSIPAAFMSSTIRCATCSGWGRSKNTGSFGPGSRPYLSRNFYRTRTTMNQTQIGNRVVVIAGPVPANENEKAGCRETAGKAVRVRRTVVIRNGELVGRGPGR